MASKINLGLNLEEMKGLANEKGWVNITLEVKDESTDWGTNVSAYRTPTSSEYKEAVALSQVSGQSPKLKKDYLKGSHKVVWTDGTIKKAN